MKKVSRIEYCASFEPLQSGMGQDGESKILFQINMVQQLLIAGDYVTELPLSSS